MLHTRNSHFVSHHWLSLGIMQPRCPLEENEIKRISSTIRNIQCRNDINLEKIIRLPGGIWILDPPWRRRVTETLVSKGEMWLFDYIRIACHTYKYYERKTGILGTGRGVLSYLKDGEACCKFWIEPLRATKILFWGVAMAKIWSFLGAKHLKRNTTTFLTSKWYNEPTSPSTPRPRSFL